MPRRKLLLLTYHFPPSAASGSFRMLGFARHLPQLDWQVSALAPPRLPWEPVDARLLEQLPDGVTVHNVPYPHGRAGKIVRRFAPNGAWLPHAFLALRRVLDQENPDVVLTSGPPQCVHLLGLYLKRRHGLPWIADFRDPWVVGDRQECRRSLRVRCARRCERAIMRHADLVVSNAPLACTKLQAGYPEFRDKIIVITNGFDPEAFPRREPGATHRDDMRILHTGELYFGRDPRPFLDALRDANLPGKPLHVRFLGRTTVGDFKLKSEIDARHLDSVVQLGGQVSYEESQLAMADANILLLIDNPGRRVGVPAKIYEYLGAGAAILALTEPDGDAAWVLRESGVLHRIAPPGDTAKIQRALTELTACVALGQPACPSPQRLSMFTRESIARTLAERLDDLVSPSSATSVAPVPEIVGSSR